MAFPPQAAPELISLSLDEIATQLERFLNYLKSQVWDSAFPLQVLATEQAELFIILPKPVNISPDIEVALRFIKNLLEPVFGPNHLFLYSLTPITSTHQYQNIYEELKQQGTKFRPLVPGPHQFEINDGGPASWQKFWAITLSPAVARDIVAAAHAKAYDQIIQPTAIFSRPPSPGTLPLPALPSIAETVL